MGSSSVDSDASNRAALRIGGKLHVVGRPESAIGHLHHSRLGVRCRGAWFFLPALFFFRFAFPGGGALLFFPNARSSWRCTRSCYWPCNARVRVSASSSRRSRSRAARNRERRVEKALTLTRELHGQQQE